MESIIASKDRLHFFEYLEVDILQEYLRTGINYFVNAILNAYPSFVGLRYYSLQISTLLDFAKDFYSLAKNKATYAQNFYELERKLGGHSKWMALKGALIWAIIPYISTKIENYYNEVVGEQIDGKRLGRLKKIFKTIYPYIYTLVSIVQVLYKFRYLYIQREKDEYYHLLFQLNGTHLGHKQKSQETKYPLLELLKKPGLLIMLMSHKIITWYFNQKRQKQVSHMRKDRVQVQAPISDEHVNEEGKCPICTKNINNPTMVKTTGYVYCFECISDFIKRDRKCPMSQLPITQNTLQILYD